MTTIRAICTDQVLQLTESPVVASGGVEETRIIITFSEDWRNLVRHVIFYNRSNEVYSVPMIGDVDGLALSCTVPWEVTRNKGYMYFGVYAMTDEDYPEEVHTSTVIRYKIEEGPVTDQTQPSIPYLGGVRVWFAPDVSASDAYADGIFINQLVGSQRPTAENVKYRDIIICGKDLAFLFVGSKGTNPGGYDYVVPHPGIDADGERADMYLSTSFPAVIDMVKPTLAQGVILKAPNGTQYALAVNDDGSLRTYVES